MARYRRVKPEFWTSDQIVNCSRDARLLFIGMWNFCDDAGIHPASCKRLKMEVFPGDDITSSDIQGWVNELLENGLIHEYEVENERYWIVTGWSHQKIEDPTFRYPKPLKDIEENKNRRHTDGIPTDTRRSLAVSKQVSNNKVSKKDLDCSELVASHPISEPVAIAQEDVFIKIPLAGKQKEFLVTKNMLQEWSELYPGVDVKNQIRALVGWNIGNPEKRKTARGVLRHIHTWLAKEQNKGGGNRGNYTAKVPKSAAQRARELCEAEER
jgi:hypothetical protein